MIILKYSILFLVFLSFGYIYYFHDLSFLHNYVCNKYLSTYIEVVFGINLVSSYFNFIRKKIDETIKKYASKFQKNIPLKENEPLNLNWQYYFIVNRNSIIQETNSVLNKFRIISIIFCIITPFLLFFDTIDWLGFGNLSFILHHVFCLLIIILILIKNSIFCVINKYISQKSCSISRKIEKTTNEFCERIETNGAEQDSEDRDSIIKAIEEISENININENE